MPRDRLERVADGLDRAIQSLGYGNTVRGKRVEMDVSSLNEALAALQDCQQLLSEIRSGGGEPRPYEGRR